MWSGRGCCRNSTATTTESKISNDAAYLWVAPGGTSRHTVPAAASFSPSIGPWGWTVAMTQPVQSKLDALVIGTEAECRKCADWLKKSQTAGTLLATDIMEWLDANRSNADDLCEAGNRVRFQAKRLDETLWDRSFLLCVSDDVRNRISPVLSTLQGVCVELEQAAGVDWDAAQDRFIPAFRRFLQERKSLVEMFASKKRFSPSGAADGGQKSGDGGSKRKQRATKKKTEARVFGAILHKIRNPGASLTECAKKGELPLSTLSGNSEWNVWAKKIEGAATRDQGDCTKSHGAHRTLLR